MFPVERPDKANFREGSNDRLITRLVKTRLQQPVCFGYIRKRIVLNRCSEKKENSKSAVSNTNQSETCGCGLERFSGLCNRKNSVYYDYASAQFHYYYFYAFAPVGYTTLLFHNFAYTLFLYKFYMVLNFNEIFAWVLGFKKPVLNLVNNGNQSQWKSQIEILMNINYEYFTFILVRQGLIVNKS